MPTVIEVDPIHRALAMLALGDPVRHGPPTMVPLLGPEAEEPGWLTLTEAGEAVTVTERPAPCPSSWSRTAPTGRSCCSMARSLSARSRTAC